MEISHDMHTVHMYIYRLCNCRRLMLEQGPLKVHNLTVVCISLPHGCKTCSDMEAERLIQYPSGGRMQDPLAKAADVKDTIHPPHITLCERCNAAWTRGVWGNKT